MRCWTRHLAAALQPLGWYRLVAGLRTDASGHNHRHTARPRIGRRDCRHRVHTESVARPAGLHVREAATDSHNKFNPRPCQGLRGSRPTGPRNVIHRTQAVNKSLYGLTRRRTGTPRRGLLLQKTAGTY